jgi:hypothetical protein
LDNDKYGNDFLGAAKISLGLVKPLIQGEFSLRKHHFRSKTAVLAE